MKRLHRFVRKVARVLGRTKSSAEVKADLGAVLERVTARLETPGLPRDEGLPLRQMLRTARAFGDALFTCYDHEDIPRTNNGHEHMYGRARASERRITGHRSTSRTVRDGPFVAPLIERAQRNELPSADELASVPAERRKETLTAMRRARDRHARPRRIRERFDAVLAELASRDLGGRPPHPRASAPRGKPILRG